MTLDALGRHVARAVDVDEPESLLGLASLLPELAIDDADCITRPHIVPTPHPRVTLRVVPWHPQTTVQRWASALRLHHPYAPHIAHSHSFALLTCGYRGPGYTTTLYEADPKVLEESLLEAYFHEHCELPPANHNRGTRSLGDE